MNKLALKISDSELEVMKIFWKTKQAMTMTEIRKKLPFNYKWKDSTIKTLLHRLHSKGVLKQEKREVYYYTPVVSEEEYEEYTTQALINKLYAGSAINLITSLVSSNKLSQEDIEELEKMLRGGDNDE